VRLRLELDADTTAALMRQAVADLRPVDMEAEALLRRVLGLPVPFDATATAAAESLNEVSVQCQTGGGA
jgi:hypothetical protein